MRKDFIEIQIWGALNENQVTKNVLSNIAGNSMHKNTKPSTYLYGVEVQILFSEK